MIRKKLTGQYVFPRLEKFADLKHAISSVHFGDMNFRKNINNANIKGFATVSGFDEEKMMFMQQEHTKTVKEAKMTKKFVYKKTDSLITAKAIVLNTTTADCVPLIFFDPLTRTVAIAHSGWKGTYKNIVSSVIKKLKAKKVKAENVIVAIGPSISVCCYDIDNLRAKKFKSKYKSTHKKFLKLKNEKNYLNLTELINIQLINEGIKSENIENADICTNHSQDFFSYRQQNNKSNTKLFLTSVGLI